VERAAKILKDPEKPIPYDEAKADLDLAKRELLEAETAAPNPVIPMPARKDVEAVSAEFRRMRHEIQSFEGRRKVLKTVVDKIRYADHKAEIHCKLPAPSTRNCHRHICANPQRQR
jgi:hypothetical protein